MKNTRLTSYMRELLIFIVFILGCVSSFCQTGTKTLYWKPANGQNGCDATIQVEIVYSIFMGEPVKKVMAKLSKGTSIHFNGKVYSVADVGESAWNAISFNPISINADIYDGAYRICTVSFDNVLSWDVAGSPNWNEVFPSVSETQAKALFKKGFQILNIRASNISVNSASMYNVEMAIKKSLQDDIDSRIIEYARSELNNQPGIESLNRIKSRLNEIKFSSGFYNQKEELVQRVTQKMNELQQQKIKQEAEYRAKNEQEAEDRARKEQEARQRDREQSGRQETAQRQADNRIDTYQLQEQMRKEEQARAEEQHKREVQRQYQVQKQQLEQAQIQSQRKLDEAKEGVIKSKENFDNALYMIAAEAAAAKARREAAAEKARIEEEKKNQYKRMIEDAEYKLSNAKLHKPLQTYLFDLARERFVKASYHPYADDIPEYRINQIDNILETHRIGEQMQRFGSSLLLHLNSNYLSVKSEKIYFFFVTVDYDIENRKSDLKVSTVFKIEYDHQSNRWPYFTDIKNEVERKYKNPIYFGYYLSLENAMSEREKCFKNAKENYFDVKPDFYQFNVSSSINKAKHSNDENLDFWGNSSANHQKPVKSLSAETTKSNVELDFWGNPIKK